MGLNNFISTDKGTFNITKEGDYYAVRNIANRAVYTVLPTEPFCSCPDFQYNKKRKELCKHLLAVKQQGAVVSDTVAVSDTKAKTHDANLKPQIVEKEQLNTSRLRNMLTARITIDAIIESSSDGLGEGVLYDRTRIGEVVKEDLVALIARASGVVSETLGLEYETVEHRDGSTIVLARARARATHTATGTSVIRSASVPLDIKRLEKESRTFADRTAESDACRRAELALLGIPEKAIINIVKKVISSYQGGGEK